MNKFLGCIRCLLIVLCAPAISAAQTPTTSLVYTVTPDPASNLFHVSLRCSGFEKEYLDLKMPAWTPGYYQIMNYADNVMNFKVIADGRPVKWEKTGLNRWRIFNTQKENELEILYEIKTSRAFVATSYMDQDRAYITPGSIFFYIDGYLQHPVKVSFAIPDGDLIATGLESEDASGRSRSFSAPDFDVLYDCPVLMGKLEALPSFEIQGVNHRFIGYRMGDFNRAEFLSDLKKIVSSGINIIGEIPYRQYTFLAIGPGQGGIEHLNSTSFGFNGSSLSSREGKIRLYNFLAHEYFHHYNVKRIRPIELGPFDYDKENRTNMLWVSEGITVYYDMLMVKRAGISTTEELLGQIRSRLRGYETQPGRLYQSATQASYQTWSDGPFGRAGEEVNKTISVYDKGAVLGLLFDFTIRHITQNTKSLDDVMRALYREYYKEKKRGFTEAEFRMACEQIAGAPLIELFEYASTVKPIDYKKYFGYGGLTIETEPIALPGAWLGATTRLRNDSLVVSSVEYESPAWNAGLRNRMVILEIDGNVIGHGNTLQPILTDREPHKKIELRVIHQAKERVISCLTGIKIEPSYAITPLQNADKLQKTILADWLRSR